MTVFQAIKRSFGITNRNLILAQPFILFLIIISIAVATLEQATSNFIMFLITLISLLLLVAAFLGGWFYMARKTIEFDLSSEWTYEEKALKSFGLIKQFLPGVGDYFLATIGLMVFYVLFFLIYLFVTIKIGVSMFGAVNIDFTALNSAAQDYTLFKNFLENLPSTQINSIFVWIMYISVCNFLFQVLTLWWGAALIYETKNPIKAFCQNLRFTFRHFWQTFGLLLFLNVVYVLVYTLMQGFGNNLVLALISFIFFFYYVTYYLITVFLFYREAREPIKVEADVVERDEVKEVIDAADGNKED